MGPLERFFRKRDPVTPAATEAKTPTSWEEIIAASHKNFIGNRQRVRYLVMTLNGKNKETGLNYFLSRVAEKEIGYGDEVESLLLDVPESVRNDTDPDFSIHQIRLEDRNNPAPAGKTRLFSLLLFCRKPHKDHQESEVYFVLSTDINGIAEWKKISKQYANS